MRRAYEEMKYFKLELKNREENFNKTFGNHPRVGTLNPLKGGVGSVGNGMLRPTPSQVSCMSVASNGFVGDMGGFHDGAVGGGAAHDQGIQRGAYQRRRSAMPDHQQTEVVVDATLLPPLGANLAKVAKEGRRAARAGSVSSAPLTLS